jgi:peptidoglycan/LPS O-acetylase OafA/YrhL
MGIISYSVYLFHEASHGLWNGLLLGRAGHPLINNPQGMAVMFVSLASTILFSILSWRFFEEPILQFGRRLSKGFQARRPIRSREQELGVPAMQPCEQDACSCSRLP